MGFRIKYTCDKCGYENSFSLGSGMGSVNPNMIARCLSDNDKNIFLQEISDGSTEFHSENKLGFCSKCNDLTTIVSVEIKKGDLKNIIGNKCCECFSEVSPIEDTSNVTCPNCHAPLNTYDDGIWD